MLIDPEIKHDTLWCQSDILLLTAQKVTTNHNLQAGLFSMNWLQAIVIDNLWQYQLVLPSPTPRAAK